jgi:hypothetical protein
MPSINIANIHEWESSSDLSNGANAILIQDLDIFSSRTSLRVARKPVKVFQGEKVTHIVDAYGESDNPILYFTESGKIYKEWEEAPVFEFYPDIPRDPDIRWPIFRLVHFIDDVVYFIAPKVETAWNSWYTEDTISRYDDSIYKLYLYDFSIQESYTKPLQDTYWRFYSETNQRWSIAIWGDIFVYVG